MVRNSVLIFILFALMALPALAQSEDFPRIETSFGYANTSLNAGGLLPGLVNELKSYQSAHPAVTAAQAAGAAAPAQ